MESIRGKNLHPIFPPKAPSRSQNGSESAGCILSAVDQHEEGVPTPPIRSFSDDAKKGHTSKAAEEEHSRSSRSSPLIMNSWEGQTFARRKQTVKENPYLQQFEELIKQGGVGLVSSDESEYENGTS